MKIAIPLPPLLWHYTLGIKMPSILKDGYLRTSPKEPRHPEKPVVWLSSAPRFECSAIKSTLDNGETRLLSIDEMEQQGQGLYRFAIDTAFTEIVIYPWLILKTVAKMPSKYRKRLVDRAKSVGARPSQWYGTLATIPVDLLMIERRYNGQWEPCARESINIKNMDRVIEGTVRELGVSMTNSHWGVD